MFSIISKPTTTRNCCIKYATIRYGILAVMASITLILPGFITSAESATGKIAIIPFEINSKQNLSYIGDGIFQMLSSRLAWKDNLQVASEKEVEDSLRRFSMGSYSDSEGKKSASHDSNLISEIASGTGADYVIRGSITEFAGAFSVDTTVFDIRNNNSRAFYAQADKADQIIPDVERLTAKINMEIFDRKNSDIALSDDSQGGSSVNLRANPEKLVPRAALEPNTKGRPFWKFWGKDEKPGDQSGNSGNQVPGNGQKQSVLESDDGAVVIHTDTDDDDDDDSDDGRKPFWKFW